MASDSALTGPDIGRLLVTCPDRPGIVAAVSRFLYEAGANIVESQQYSTNPFGGTFFLLVVFHLPGLAYRDGELADQFTDLANSFGMDWKMTRAAHRKKVAIFVSRADHALQELVWRNHSGELNCDIQMIISNHPDAAPVAATWDIPFHHIPVTPQTKQEAEAVQLKLLGDDIDLVVLARYMQVLSPAFFERWSSRVINIHHSFLPAFAGLR